MADSSAGSPLPAGVGGGESKAVVQMRRLQEANAKYKKLLQLAKERIQQQEEEILSAREENERLQSSSHAENGADKLNMVDDAANGVDEQTNIVQVCQRVKQTIDSRRGLEDIWALVEMEVLPANDMDTVASRRFKEWKRFDTEAQLQDFIRRDTGEPLTLPPYSLSPEQSATIQSEALSQVSQVTEDFRRFRVRAELARKQAESQIRDLQNNNVTNVAQRIEGKDMQHELDQARSVSSQLERLKADLAAQEAHWKEAYEVLLQENQALKSSGSEALLASQWRHRYESCLREKEALESRLQASAQRGDNDDGKWEAKYRDLKESFRLYRKKAKEIFETQERGGVITPQGMPPFTLNDQSSAEAKLSYLKNLMVNFLSCTDDVKEHMETAIATILQFSPDDLEKIQKQKAENGGWFSIY